jgi:hypothetical protein
MCSFPVLLSRGLGILLGVVVTTMAHGQQSKVAPASSEKAPPPAAVHRMVIQEGPNRRVHYITTGNISASDREAAYNLERAENELTYAHDLQRLKQQYVNSERVLEPHRRAVQQRLYGLRTQSGSYSATSYSPGADGGYAGGYYGYPSGYYPFFNNGWGYGSGGYPGGVYSWLGTSWDSTARSLQYGVGDEGRMKNALVQVIAQEATPSHAAAAVRDYDAAAARAAASPVLSRDLGLSKSAAAAPAEEPKLTKGGKATIWVGNDKYVGTVKDDLPGWIVLQTDKAEVTVRKSEITRSEVPSKP